MSNPSTRTSAALTDFPAGGRPLARHVRMLAWLLRGFYFGRVRVVGTQQAAFGRRLIVSSHRNGAIDGYNVLRGFPGAQGLVSIQLLRHPCLRWLFDGLVVVRDKDRARFGALRHTFGSPIDAGCAQLRAGGNLVVFPEGSSEWGFRPLPYQRGAARIATTLLAEGRTPQVIPLGLHYREPDRFRSQVELLQGEPVELPARSADETERAWQGRTHEAIAAALDEVSVNCPDPEAFASARAHAAAAADAGLSYALAFIDAQQRLRAGQRLPPPPVTAKPHRWPWDWLAVAAFMLLAGPVLLAGWLAGRRADARNTVSFFRMVGGLAAALPWLPCLLLASWRWPLPMLALWVLAAAGWWRWPRVMHRGNG